MRRIAIINQKGGVGKTTTAVNLGAALARLGRRVVVIDMDPQANASMNLGAELGPDEPSTYSILTQGGRVADTLSGTSTPGLSVIPAHLDLSGAELELASAIGRETILRDALDEWEEEELERTGRAPADVVLIDNPPSLGLLSVNGLAASQEVLIAVQTEFFALQGLSKLVEIVQLLRRRLNPDLEITGVLACMYDSRLRLAREVLGELRTHFPGQVFRRPIAQNVKLAETPSFSRTIFEYAPESRGAEDYLAVGREFLEREGVSVDSEGRAIESAAEQGPTETAADVPAEPPAVTDALAEVDVPAAPRPPGEPDRSDTDAGARAPSVRAADAPDVGGDATTAVLIADEPSAAAALDPGHPDVEEPDAKGLDVEALDVEERALHEAVPDEPALEEPALEEPAPAEPALEASALKAPAPGMQQPAPMMQAPAPGLPATEAEVAAPEAEPIPEIEVTPPPRLRTPARTRSDDRGEERAEVPSRRGPSADPGPEPDPDPRTPSR